MTSEALQLSQSIQTSVLRLQQLCETSGYYLPSLRDTRSPDIDRFREVEGMTEVVDRIIAACSELTALVQPPSMTAMQFACGHVQSAALRVLAETNIVELLRESENGLHIREIALRTGLPEGKIGRILRYLSAHHIIQEVTPNVFSNNRVSKALDSARGFEDIKKDPEAKYDGSKEKSFSSLVEIFAGDLHKSSAYLLENLLDPETSQSEEANHAPFNRAFNVKLSLFQWYNQPEQRSRLRRFITAMQGTDELQKDDGIKTALNWNLLSPGSVIVDVGGGWGKAILPLAKEQRHLRYVIQDKAEVVSAGKKRMISSARQLSGSDQSLRQPLVELGWSISPEEVTFQAHDVFSPQPIENASLFILKHVLHAFSDTYAAKILRNLREAATSHTHLLIIDTILPYTCIPESDDKKVVVGLDVGLIHHSPAFALAFNSDLTMMLQLNAQERTLEEMRTLLEKTGWKLTDMKGGKTLMQPLLAVPI